MTSGSGPMFVGPDVASWQTMALVAQPEDPTKDTPEGADFGKSSPVGLLVLLLFFIAVAFLVRSMTKHLKRVPASFDEPAEKPSEPESDSSPESEPADSVESDKK